MVARVQPAGSNARFSGSRSWDDDDPAAQLSFLQVADRRGVAGVAGSLRCTCVDRRHFVHYIALFTYSKQTGGVNKSMEMAQQAAEALQRLTGLPVTYDSEADTLFLLHQDRPIALRVRGIERVTRAKLAELVHEESGADSIVVAPALTVEQATLLREAGVNYLDAAGNTHIKAQDAVVLVQGRKPAQPDVESTVTGRAFQPAGLKVLFTLLVDPARVNETYRDLADRVNVSPATVKYVLDDLEQRGHAVKIGRGRGMSRRLTDVAALAGRWANSYGDLLRPKLLRGRYRFLDADKHRGWKELTLNEAETCWGGEPAADLFTGYLRAEKLTLYTTASTGDLARALRIVPAADGPVDVLDKFWVDDVEIVASQPVVPRLLAYADLLASGQTRNLEAAQPLFDAWANAALDQQ
jgi:hypothetical protein